MIRPLACVFALLALCGCNSIGITGKATPAKNVGVSVGTVLTPSGISNNGSVSVKLF